MKKAIADISATIMSAPHAADIIRKELHRHGVRVIDTSEEKAKKKKMAGDSGSCNSQVWAVGGSSGLCAPTCSPDEFSMEAGPKQNGTQGCVFRASPAPHRGHLWVCCAPSSQRERESEAYMSICRSMV